MKKTLFSVLRTMCVGAMTLFAVSCYDDSALWGEVDRLDGRIDSLALELNKDVANLAALQTAVTELETSLEKAIADGDAAVKKALEDQLATVKADLEKAIADGDKAIADALATEKTAIETALKNLQEGLTSVTGSVADLEAALKTFQATVGTEYAALLGKLDELDGVVDGHIANMETALAALKAADEKLNTELVAALAKIAVVKVEEANGNVVLTLADGSKVELSKPLANVDNNGLVTIVEENGVKYWKVVGADTHTGVVVGHPDTKIEFQINATTNELEYRVNAGEWTSTGVAVEATAENVKLITAFEQTEEYVKLTIGGTEVVLPKYKAENPEFTFSRTDFFVAYEASKTVELETKEIEEFYVMSKPDGWKVRVEETTLVVSAPTKEAAEIGAVENEGEILLHATTKAGKCYVVKLNVRTGLAFNLTLDEKDSVNVFNATFEAGINEWTGREFADFCSAQIGVVEKSVFESYSTVREFMEAAGYEEVGLASTYLENMKNNHGYGSFYEKYVYEEDQFNVHIDEFLACLVDPVAWRPFVPEAGKSYVVWGLPMTSTSYLYDDAVYFEYAAPVKAEITAVEGTTTTSDFEVKVEVVGAETYYVGMVTEEMTYGYPIDEYMLNQQGPFGYFQMALQYGMEDYAFQYMGIQFGGEYGMEMPETIKASELNNGPLMPESKVYMWVFPVVDGFALADYTYEKNLKPYIFSFTTNPLSAGGAATIEFGEENLQYTSMSVDLVATEGTTMIYYQWYDADAYNEIEDVTADLLEYGMVLGGEKGTARNNGNVQPGASFVLAALAVDADGKYGEVAEDTFTAPEIEYSTTFTAVFGEETSEVFNGGFKYDFPITVTGGTAAKYYYVFSTTEFSDEQLANLPLTYEYNYNFRSASSLNGLYADANSTYYLAVVVESEDGELAPVIKKTVTVPAVPAE